MRMDGSCGSLVGPRRPSAWVGLDVGGPSPFIKWHESEIGNYYLDPVPKRIWDRIIGKLQQAWIFIAHDSYPEVAH